MKTLILTATLVAATLSTLPAAAMVLKAGINLPGTEDSVERRRARTPGGSGCDGKTDIGKTGC